MLTSDMKTLITDHRAGMVATINDDGTPAVSPKATFVIIDNARIAVGNIRSPGTVANLRKRPAVEVCFIDVVTRKAVRVTGQATVTPKAKAEAILMEAFEREWAPYLEHISAFIDIKITAAELILSPGYDLGFTEAELKSQNLAKLNAL